MPDWWIPHLIIGYVHDGDTPYGDIDVGWTARMINWGIRLCISKRIWINAIELKDPGGPEAQANLAGLLPPGGVFELRSFTLDTYRQRCDADIILHDGSSLAQTLVANGWATAFPAGTSPMPTPPWPRPVTRQGEPLQ
jgi:hypothetical protein